MKYHYLRAIALMLFACTWNLSFASVGISADVSYTCVANNSYRVNLRVTQDANGIGLNPIQSLRYRSTACNVDAQISLVQLNSAANDPSSGCTQAGMVNGEEIVFSGILNLPDCASGNDWILSWDICCRNGALTNVSDPQLQDLYVETLLDQTLSSCNSSPSIQLPPQLVVCQGQEETLSFQAFDLDGDFLSYQLVNCEQSSGVSISYAPPYSGIFPMLGGPAASINPSTGIFRVGAVIPGRYALCVRVEEFRSGTKIGEVTRDLELAVVDCQGTSAPSLSGFGLSDPAQPGSFSAEICVGEESCLDIGVFGTASIPASLSIGQIPGSSNFAVNGNGSTNPTGSLCWSPLASDAGNYEFVVLLETEDCPYNRYRYETYSLTVVDPGYQVSITQPSALCAGGNVQLDALVDVAGGAVSNFSWSPVTGLNNPAFEDPIANPEFSTLYTLTVNFADGCVRTADVFVEVNEGPSVSLDPQIAYGCVDIPVILSASVNSTVPITNYSWSTGQNGSSQDAIQVGPGFSSTYSVTVTDQNGCQAVASSEVLVGVPPDCQLIYAGPSAVAGNGDGSIQNPYELQEAIDLLACTGGTIRLLNGTYNRSSALVLKPNVTLDGGFNASGVKSSAPGLTVIRRNAAGNDGTSIAPALIAVRAADASGFRLQDVDLETADAPANLLPAVSTYGLYLENCSDYDVVRTRIFPGNAGDGRSGNNGGTGANGLSGGGGENGFGDDNDEEQNGGFGGSGGGSGAGNGALDAFGNGCTMFDAVSDIFGCNGCTSGCNGGQGQDASTSTAGSGGGGGGGGGQQARNGGIGGGAGDVPGGSNGPNGPGVSSGNICRTSGFWDGQNAACNGCGVFSACDPTETSSHSGACGRDGFDGQPGAPGTNGTPGIHNNGLFVPGSQANAGTRGTGGTGGAGGGGGAGQGTTGCADGSGASGGGGGGGGEAGFPGSGGAGGGSSYAIYLHLNGPNGRFQTSLAQSGDAGEGGNGGIGGNGGSGGNGGTGGNGTPAADPQVGFGGDGGNGGDGGKGGNGGNGADGESLQIFVNGNSPSLTDINFNLSALPVITWDGGNCTNTDIFFTGSGVNSPQQFSSTNGTDREDIVGTGGIYYGFIDISSVQETPEILVSTNAFSNNTYRICEGEILDFSAANSSPGTSYSWTFSEPNGVDPIASDIVDDPDASSVTGLVFNVAGNYTVQLQQSTECCGQSGTALVNIEVGHQPVLSLSDVLVCPDGSGVQLDAGLTTAFGQAFPGGSNDNWSFSWAPSTGLDTNTGQTVVANPVETTTYTVTALNSSGACPLSTQVTVEVEDFSGFSLSAPGIDACNDEGFILASTPLAFNNYSFSWRNENGGFVLGTFLVPNLSAGNYFVTITDQNSGCVFQSSIAVQGQGGIDGYVQNVVSPTCPSYLNGTATVGDLNQTAALNIQWPASASNQSGPTATNLAAGNYAVTLSDQNDPSCFDIIQVQVPAVNAFQANIVDAIDVECPGLGSLTASGEFGSGNYLYSWNNGGFGPTISGLEPNTYTVNIIDVGGGGCVASANYTIQDITVFEPVDPGTGISNELNFSSGCNGANPDVNNGLPFLQQVNNDCVPSGSIINACGDVDLSQHPVYYTVQTNETGIPDQDLEISVLPPTSGDITIMEAALYGPVDPACPQISGGSFVDCQTTGDPSTGLQLTLPGTSTDGQVYLLIVDTEGSGTFSIRGQAPAPLPLELVEFKGKTLETGAHLLSWITQQEYQVSHFVLQRSNDARDFEAISPAIPARNNLEVNTYEFVDAQPEIGANYYRLKIIDEDGTFALSQLVVLNVENSIQNGSLSIRPNPTGSISWLELESIENAEIGLKLFSVLGQTLKTERIGIRSGNNQIPIDLSDYPDGTYLLQIESGNRLHQFKILKINP